MLYYFCATDKQLKKIEEGKGIRMNGQPLLLDDNLRRARKRRQGSIVAVAGDKLKKSPKEAGNGTLRTKHIPGDAFLNVQPYRKIREVVAAGGLVTKRKKGKMRVLLIYKRGVWDLPKGKRNRGETIKECALREVQEELGISNLSVVKPIGQTIHGFDQGKLYRIKTTHWYEMTTSEKEFTPDESEGIEDVRWFKWKKAVSAIGYKSLREFMDDVKGDLEA